MPHKIEPSPSGRASCRGCKKAIEKGALRFGEEVSNPYSDEGGTTFRYFHLECAIPKLANEVAAALVSFPGEVPERERIDARVAQHLRPDLPYAERAATGRARCRACDETIARGELRLAFERTLETAAGPQRGVAYTHPRCAGAYLDHERERGRQAMETSELARLLDTHSKLPPADMAEVTAAVLAGTRP